MPIYEFYCLDCQATFEKLCLSLKEAEEVTCPSCGSSKVKKLLSSFSCSTSTQSIGSSCGSGSSGFK